MSGHMGIKEQETPHISARQGVERTMAKLAILALLLALAGLSTLAKQGQFYPRTNPVRQISAATKMSVPQTARTLDCVPTQPAARLILPQPQDRPVRMVAPELSSIAWAHLTLPLQHRAPPLSVA